MDREPPLAPGLAETRDAIDDVDLALLDLLVRRAELSRQARIAKDRAGQQVHDPAREAALLATRRAWAASRGLDGPSIEDVFRAVLRFSRHVQG